MTISSDNIRYNVQCEVQLQRCLVVAINNHKEKNILLPLYKVPYNEHGQKKKKKAWIDHTSLRSSFLLSYLDPQMATATIGAA